MQKGQGSRSGKICNHCGKKGHTIDNCYRKHGFPPGYKFTNPKKSANYVGLEESRELANEELSEDSLRSNSVITQEQYKELIALLQNSKVHPPHQPAANLVTTALNVSYSFNPLVPRTKASSLENMNQWTLDIGATDHICLF